ncbi:MAG: DnaA regulatory inactivator Hda [Pseudomonadales bacterium]
MSGRRSQPPAGAARHAQLALRFPLAARARFDDFVDAGNEELVRRLKELDAGEAGFRGYLLFGPAGSGRSHLLQAACHAHAGRGAMYLPLADRLLTPQMLDGLDALGLVALDDVDAWLGREEAERALLALYQGLQAAGGRLLVGSARPPASLACRFPDLGSRLRGLAAYQVQPLGDAGRALLLRRLAAQRGLEVGAAVLDFWLSRSPRELPALLAELDRLDQAAMAAQRRLTVPLVKQVLGL